MFCHCPSFCQTHLYSKLLCLPTPGHLPLKETETMVNKLAYEFLAKSYAVYLYGILFTSRSHPLLMMMIVMTTAVMIKQKKKFFKLLDPNDYISQNQITADIAFPSPGSIYNMEL